MREEFEKLPAIKRAMKDGSVEWDDEDGCYGGDDDYCSGYVNGAWHAHQEQQKKINDARKEINDFFDNQTMTPSPREYANKLADVFGATKMTKQEIRDGAPSGATDYLIYDGSLYYFQKRGVHMHQWIKTRFNPIPFSCASFYNFKPL